MMEKVGVGKEKDGEKGCGKRGRWKMSRKMGIGN